MNQLNFSVVFMLIFFQWLPFGITQNLEELFGFGRSIAGVLSSGLNDFIQISESAHENNKISQDSGTKKHISTDDLFSGLSDVWSSKKIPEIEKHFTEQSAQEIPEKSKQNTLSKNKNQPQVINDSNAEETLNHWVRIRIIVENMKSLFLDNYGENSRDKLEILNMLDRIMEIGDKINEIQTIKDTFDHDLLEFLKVKWDNVERDILNSSPALNTMLSVDGKVLLLTIAQGLVRQFGKTFHKQAFAHVKEQDFVIETMRKSGFTDSEIYEVFQLLDLPTENLLSTSKTMNTSNEMMGDMAGRSGGHGHGGGYGMMKKDPLLLLAGLAFATYAAYIIYRLVSSTPAPPKRSFEDTFSLTLSDMPEFVGKVYSWLENAEDLYGNSEKDVDMMDRDELVNSINRIWRSYDLDRQSRSCLRRYLCYHLNTNADRFIRYGSHLEKLALLVAAQLMGVEGAGKQMDSQLDKLLKGRDVDCKINSPSCTDDQFYSKVLQNQAKR